MKKLPKSEFTEFKKWCDYYIELFGLKQYRIVYRFKKLNGNYAQANIDDKGMIAVISLNSDLHDDYVSAKTHAKHEIIHLALSKLIFLGECRFVDSEEITDEEEMLVRRLEKVIN